MDRIFSWINRINSVLFLLVLIGVSIGATLTYLAYQEMFDRYYRETASVASESEPAEQPLRLSLGEVDRINGSDTLMVFLFSEEPWGSKGRNEEIRNVLFLSGDGAHARWLFETHTNLLQEIDELRRQDQSTEALYYEIVRTDSDGDGELTDYDMFAVALSKSDGSGFTEVLSGVTRVLSHQQIDHRQLAIVYQIEEAVWHARFDLDTFAKLSEQSLLEVPQQM